MEMRIVYGEVVLEESWKKAGGLFTQRACTFFRLQLGDRGGQNNARFPAGILYRCLAGATAAFCALTDGGPVSVIKTTSEWMFMDHT